MFLVPACSACACMFSLCLHVQLVLAKLGVQPVQRHTCSSQFSSKLACKVTSASVRQEIAGSLVADAADANPAISKRGMLRTMRTAGRPVHLHPENHIYSIVYKTIQTITDLLYMLLISRNICAWNYILKHMYDNNNFYSYYVPLVH